MSGEQWGEATRAPMRRFALASITAHLYPNEANAIEQEAAARAVLELIVADTRREVAEEQGEQRDRVESANNLIANAEYHLANARRDAEAAHAKGAAAERDAIEAEVEKLKPSTGRFWTLADSAHVSAYGSVVRLIRLRREAAIARGSGNGGTA